MSSPVAEATDEYEALIQFLYLVPSGLAQCSLDGTVEMINPKAAQLLMPLSRDGGLDNLFDLMAEAAPTLRSLVADLTTPTGVVCDSLRMPGRAVAGEVQVLSLSMIKLGRNRLMAVLNDVTQEVRREQLTMSRRLDDQARTDSLTHMPNRAALLDQLNAARGPSASGESPAMAVLFINCDRFKQINDALGRAVGDQLLALMADRLRSTLRQRDTEGRSDRGATMAARIGADEFVVLLQDLKQPDDVHAVARRLMEALDPPYGIGSQQVRCHVSMGIVLGAQAMGAGDAVLQDANIAMDQAKRAGGDRYVVFEPWMQKAAVRRAVFEVEMRRGLERGEFFVVYQPVVGLQQASGIDRSAGVEALVRWNHPERGLVPPLEFIGEAEECGLIKALGHFVLETACGQFVQWQRDLGGRAPRLLAVNLSRAQLGEPGFVDSVRDVLTSTGMNPRQLQLELTESLAAQDEAVQTRLHELKGLGLTIALDDFGTGYSSLASLHLLPVDTVKIDRSFVTLSPTSAHHRVLIEATVKVAQSLDMLTVAEGIETQAQADVVRDLGCNKGQGYLFGKPMTAELLERWLGARL
ncbi:MAG: diguanylate cyclase/phosphodiesterase [Rhizobacter sp.]|nr:diguanylate cyclase/phosphodiesterase [Rhizobacter sp.]